MSNLYEVTNGYVGQAPICVYAWAQNESDALGLAVERFKEDAGEVYPKKYWDRERLKIKRLFEGDAVPFATQPSDTGWEM